MCDRIYVINDGEIIDCLSSKEANQETIMRAILRHQKAIVKE
jgi:ABC-type sugar transport system ATPase subunit